MRGEEPRLVLLLQFAGHGGIFLFELAKELSGRKDRPMCRLRKHCGLCPLPATGLTEKEYRPGLHRPTVSSSILAERDLCIELLREVKSDLYGNQESGTAQYKRGDAGQPLHDGRRDCDEAEKDSAREGDAMHHRADVTLGLGARPNAWNEGASLLQIFRDAVRLEGHGRVEIRKEDDEEEVDSTILNRKSTRLN